MPTGQEHVLIKSALDAASAACAAWRKRRSPDTGEAPAVALDALNTVAQSHLDDGEQKIVPLAAVTFTQQEWRELGEHGVVQIPGTREGSPSGTFSNHSARTTARA